MPGTPVIGVQEESARIISDERAVEGAANSCPCRFGVEASALEKVKPPISGLKRCVAAIRRVTARGHARLMSIFGIGNVQDNAIIHVIDSRNIEVMDGCDPDSVIIIMPTNNISRAHETARVLVRRAGMSTQLFILNDVLGWGFAKTLNAASERVRCKYIVYVADDVFPSVNWLLRAFSRIERTGQRLVAFNDGIWGGTVAMFGMVDKSWVDSIYGARIFYHEYNSSWAQVELSLIASAIGELAFDPESALISRDTRAPESALTEFSAKDRELFTARLGSGFAGVVPSAELEPYQVEYLSSVSMPSKAQGLVRLENTQSIASVNFEDPNGVAVIMPCINIAKGQVTARLLAERAGMSTTVFVVEDMQREGFIKTLNSAAERLNVRYVVYLAEDAMPGIDWLKIGYERLEREEKSLLAFNCGKWSGRIAAFGMVRTGWARQLYGGPILYPGYRTHRADNELTAIARATNQFIYASEALIMEIDSAKVFRTTEADSANFTPTDKYLFIDRFNSAFGGLVDRAQLEPFRREYVRA